MHDVCIRCALVCAHVPVLVPCTYMEARGQQRVSVLVFCLVLRKDLVVIHHCVSHLAQELQRLWFLPLSLLQEPGIADAFYHAWFIGRFWCSDSDP